MIVSNKIGHISLTEHSQKFLDFVDFEWYETKKRIIDKISQNGQSLRIKFLNAPGELNYLGLTENRKEHFEIYDVNKNNWDYYFTNYRGEGLKSNMELVHHIKVGNYPIMGIYKRKEVK